MYLRSTTIVDLRRLHPHLHCSGGPQVSVFSVYSMMCVQSVIHISKVPWEKAVSSQFTSLNSPHETSAYETSWRVSHGSRKLHWSGLCSEILADGCVCGSFEVVADVLKYPSEDRRFGEQELFDSFLMVLKRRRRVLLCRWALYYTRSYQKGTHEGRIITLMNL